MDILKMFCLQPMLRQKLSTPKMKNIIWLVEKYDIHSLAAYQHYYKKNIHAPYRIQNCSTHSNKNDVTVSEGSKEAITKSTFENVKEGSKTVWYGGIVLAGFGITAVFLYTLFNQLFSSKSPVRIWSKAFKKCLASDKVIDALGEPIKCYGEETRRGRRKHVSHFEYVQDGVNYMRMKFYLKGSRRTATVHLEMKENEKGKYDYRYLFVQIDEYPYATIILEDNRNQATPPQILPFTDSN